MSEYEAFVRERMAAGDDPNAITRGLERALGVVATDWAQWGDMRWRLDTVCSVCGDELVGICGHSGQPDREVILRREYEARQQDPEPAP